MAECLRCSRPMPDAAQICHPDAQELAQTLQEAAGHAEDAETVIARQTRYGTAGNGTSNDPLPVDLTAATKLRPITTTIARWVDAIATTTGRRPRWRPMTGPTCPTGVQCPHHTCAAIRRRLAGPPTALYAAWLAQHTDALRRHPDARRAFTELHQACDDLARLVDRPPDKALVGVCDCGRVLYARHDQTDVRCPETTCRLVWNVAESRNILRTHLDSRLVTAAEAARLAAYLDTDRNQEQIRKLINKWAERRLVAAHGELGDEPAFRFGDIADRLARTPRRATRATVVAAA